MSNDIRDIIERLAILEGRVTPTTVKSGLNPQQKSVPQLPALFKPKHISVLQNKTDPEHPMHDYAVGASESEESEEEMVDEGWVVVTPDGYLDVGVVLPAIQQYIDAGTTWEELNDDPRYYKILADKANIKPEHVKKVLDMYDPRKQDQDDNDNELNEAQANEEKLLDKVKKSLTDYLTSVADQYKDDSISKKAKDRDLGKRAKDKDLVVAKNVELDEDPTDEEPANTDQAPVTPVINPTYSVSAPGAIKTYTMEDGRALEICGEEATGFEIRHGNRSIPSRFKSLDEAELACKMYEARCRRSNEAADYVDEA